MGTLSSLFDLSRASLAADQSALNATANNVANQNSPGYVRQVVNWSSADSVTLSNTGSSAPASGPTVSVTSRRDRVLEQRVQQQTQAQSQTSARASVLAQIESVFSLSGSSATAGSTQIGTALDGFFSTLTALAANPSDTATRAGVLSSAGVVASAFNAAASQLQQVGSSISGELSSSATAVNALTTTIAGLNAQIGANSPGKDAGPLEDQRQQAIAQLSQFMGLDQISTESNGITLTTQGGTELVSGNRAYPLTAVNTGGQVELRDHTGQDVSATVTGGSIGGQLAAQNIDLPAVTSALDAVAFRLATAVNAQNAAGTTPAGTAGPPIFAVSSTTSGAATALAVLASSAAALATAASGEGATGNTNATALADIPQSVDPSGLTVSGQYAGLLAQVGSTSSSLQEQSTAQSASLAQLTTQRNSFSGVSLDDEAANLSQYQRTYEAGAKLLSILNTLMGVAINLGTPTTVS